MACSSITHLLLLLLFVCTASAKFTIKRKVYYNEPFRFRKVLSYRFPPSSFAPSPSPLSSYSSSSLSTSKSFNTQFYASFAYPPEHSASSSLSTSKSFNAQFYAYASPPAESPPPPPSSSSSTLIVIIVVMIVAVIATLIAAFMCFKWWKTRQKKLPQISEMELSLQRRYSYADLCIATKRFSQEQLLGKGGYGKVYKGIMPNDKSMVAVKVMSAEGVDQFLAELSVIGLLRHKNIVSLKGWCHHQKKLILVYEYMPNGSLDQHLFSPEKMLCWSQRNEIVKGVAEGLLFLHCGWEKRIVHRDIKSANVLLDSKFTARLGDFGLSKLMEDNRTKQTMTRAGTMGYIAPELAYLGKASEKSDIYSFGILLLEIACGKPILSIHDECSSLLDWVWQAHFMDDLLAVVDPRLSSDYNQDEMRATLCLGLLCTQPDADLRPSMKKCCQILNFEAALPDLPHSRPTMFFGDHRPLLSLSTGSEVQSSGISFGSSNMSNH